MGEGALPTSASDTPRRCIDCGLAQRAVQVGHRAGLLESKSCSRGAIRHVDDDPVDAVFPARVATRPVSVRRILEHDRRSRDTGDLLAGGHACRAREPVVLSSSWEERAGEVCLAEGAGGYVRSCDRKRSRPRIPGCPRRLALDSGPYPDVLAAIAVDE